MIHTCGVETIT